MQGHNLEYRSLDLQNGDTPGEATIWLDVHNPFEPAEVRREHLVIPQKHGQQLMTGYKHRRVIELRGFVRGVGSTPTERQQSFRDASEALQAVIDLTLDPAPLIAFAPYLGLPTGSQSSIDALPLDAVPGTIDSVQSHQRWSIKLLCISDPPEWVTDESS